MAGVEREFVEMTAPARTSFKKKKEKEMFGDRSSDAVSFGIFCHS